MKLSGLLPPLPRCHRAGLALVALMTTLLLCSCRAPLGGRTGVEPLPATIEGASPAPAAAGTPASARPHAAVIPASYESQAPCPAPCPTYPALPPDAFTGRPYDGYTVPGLPDDEFRPADPCCPRPPWAPPGIARPWPTDEYLCDGGDRNRPTRVGEDFRVRGLEMEDTIVHYDTVDGRRLVEPSNRVCVYAPRFAAVRRITSALQHDQQDRVGRLNQPLQAFQSDELQIATTAVQPVQPIGQIGTKQPTTFLQELRGQGLEAAQAVAGFKDGLLPYENLEIIKTGRVEQSDKPRLAQAVEAAVAWTQEKAVQVLIDREPAHEMAGDSKTQLTYQFVLPPGKQRVRVCKIASKQNALPGETIDFTLRFDNVGDQPVGNVTVIDNLTSRLEYVPDSAQCSVEADFFTEENEGQSLVLRWEIIQPLEVGQGGLIRFQCRVR